MIKSFINAVDIFMTYFFWVSWIIPMSKTIKVNLFNGLLVIGLMGVMNYYYDKVTGTIKNLTDGILAGLGDLSGLIGMVSILLDPLVDIIYKGLTIIPTLKFAMDTLSFLSPTKMVPKIINSILNIAEFSVGFMGDIFTIIPTTSAFITIYILTIIYGIHMYFNGGAIRTFNLVIGTLKSNFEKYILNSTDTTKIKNLQNEIIDKSKKEPVIKPVENKMDGPMGEFQNKIKNLKNKVDLIETVRKGYAYDPNNPKKELEMNLDTMIRNLNNQISIKGY